jgi:hypothetical protein
MGNGNDQTLQALEKLIHEQLHKAVSFHEQSPDYANSLKSAKRRISRWEDLTLNKIKNHSHASSQNGLMKESEELTDAHVRLIKATLNDFSVLKAEYALSIDNDKINSLLIHITTEYLPQTQDAFALYSDNASEIIKARAFTPEKFTAITEKRSIKYSHRVILFF